MGTQNSATDEWLELYNNADYGINLNGWSLKAKGSLTIQLEGAIPAKGFYILERTDDNALPLVKADQIFKGSLNNNGAELSLYRKDGSLAEKVDCSGGWFGGNNKTKQTMERIDPGKGGETAVNWQTSLADGGTPGEKNSTGAAKKQKEANSLERTEKDGSVQKTSLSASLDGQKGKTGPIKAKAWTIAFGLAIFSGATIILLKRSLQQIRN